ncbi:MAG: hypothetical protein WAN44_17165 [Propionibacteriaceae bacterium]
MTTRLADQTLDRLQQLSSSTPRSVPLPVTRYEHHLTLPVLERRALELLIARGIDTDLVEQHAEAGAAVALGAAMHKR